jgi:osmotically-inducible protein OsmY
MQPPEGSSLFYSVVIMVSLTAGPLLAQTQPDNSGVNKDHAVTADSQSMSKSDRMITRKVRRAVMDDKDLSTYAHNVKIITVNGSVTLKGPVKSDEEKAKVAADAASVVNTNSITDQLTVKIQ